jgi:excinuclease ABC subunit C
MVVFEDGVPKSATASSRCAGWRARTTSRRRQIVARRFARLAARGDDWDESFAATPNLVVIDGGKGQLSAALAAMEQFDLPRVAVSSRSGRGVPPWPAPPGGAGGALTWLQLVADPRRGAPARDRVHPTRRDAAARESMFDQIEGVGSARRRALPLLRLG